jgi:tetratricopeptide (TPR) repeat protein
MMRKVKIAILFSGLVAALMMSACQRSAQSYLKSGDEHYKAKKYKDASLDYRNAIRQNGKLGEAYYGLGLADLKLNQFEDAWPALKTAADLLPDRTDVKIELADLAMVAYQIVPRDRVLYDLLHRLSDELLAKDANSFEGLRLKGDLALLDKKPEQAIEYFERANRIRPLEEYLVVGYTQALLDAGKPDMAEQLARQLIAQKKDFGPIYDFLYRLYFSAGRQDAAVAILREKIDNNPQDASAAIQLASHYEHANNPAAMTATLQEILKNRAAYGDGHLLVGNFYAQRHRWDEAVAVFQEGVTLDPTHARDYRRRIAVAYANQGKTEEALTLLNQLLEAAPGDREAAVLRAGLLQDRGKPEDLTTVIVVYEAALKSNPKDAAIAERLGKAYLAKNDLTNARRVLLATMKMQPDAEQPRVLLASLALREGKPAEALQFLGDLSGSGKASPRMRYLGVVALMNLNRYEDARTALNSLVHDLPKATDLLLLKGLLAVATKRYPEAEATFSAASLNQSDPRATVGLADAYVAEMQFDRALKLLDTELRKTPTSVPVRRAYAKTALSSGKFDVAIAEFERLVAAEPKSADLVSDLGEAYRAKGDFQKAAYEFQQASTMNPKNPTPRLLLSFALFQSGKVPEAMAEYKEVLSLDPENATAMNNLAYGLAEAGGEQNLAAALQLAQKAVQRNPVDPDFRDTLGWIYLKQGSADSALQIFEGVTRDQPKNPSYQHHLGLALLAKRDQAGARQALETAMANHPSDGEAQQVRGELSRLK